MIKITKVTIANYRSYKNKENIIYDIKRINLFTGKNNSGKTNILRAISLFFNPELYDPLIDTNMIKKVTAGDGQRPSINIEFEDDELIKGEVVKYTIQMNLNNKEKYKQMGGKRKLPGLENEFKIKSKVIKKFKCIFLSTTDENLSDQAFSLVNDMILKYYKSRNNAVKKTINDFESNYKKLIQTFNDNIDSLETELSKEFSLFKNNSIDIVPRLKLNNDMKISDFLTENIQLELDDTYSQVLMSKGAGIQRTSLIILSFFLITEIYKKENKIILIDEPEAFLYPLLISGLKSTIEDSLKKTQNSQIFLTSHSREFLTEINNEKYSFYNIKQEGHDQLFARSNKIEKVEKVKYSTISQFDDKTKYEVLKNYGLLDEINDHDSVIICEGKTDANYLIHILSDKEYRPQIRYGKYSNFLNPNEDFEIFNEDLKHKFVARGANSIIPILIYLDRISSINRKVFILLDGDDEGKKVYKTIKENEFKHLKINKFIIEDNKEIEDMVFTKEDFFKKIIESSPLLEDRKVQFKDALDSMKDEVSLITCTENFIETFNIQENINRLKKELSINLEGIDIKKTWILPELESTFY